MEIHTRRSALTIALFLFGATALSDNTHELNIASDATIVEVETRQGPREFIQLPTLRYELEIQRNCPADLEPANLSISVADTRRTLSAEKLATADRLTMQLSIPGEQIAPIAIAGFCAANAGDTHTVEIVEDNILLVEDVLSLQASLLCASDTESLIYYASTALDVQLHCAQADTDVQSTAN